MKKFIKNAVLTALIMSMGLIISCVQNNGVTTIEDSSRTVTVTIAGDVNLLSTDTSFTINAGTLWKNVRTNKVIKELKFAEKYTVDTWRLKDSNGEEMMESYPFYVDTTIYVVTSEKVTITINGEHIKNGSLNFIIKKGSKWSDIKDKEEIANVEFNDGYTIDEWKLGNAGGTVISDDTTFNEDTGIYAVASEKVTITIAGDNLQKTDVKFDVKKDSKWSEIRNKAEIVNVEFKEHCTLDVWKIGKPDGDAITNDTLFSADTVIYAVSSEKVTITLDGKHLKNAGVSFLAKKGSEWRDLKTAAPISNAEFSDDYILDVWKIKKPNGKEEEIYDTNTFDENATIYAVASEKIIIKIKGDHLLNENTEITVKRGAKWSEIKTNPAIASVQFTDNFTLDEWVFKKLSRDVIYDDAVFNENTTIYANASEKVTITINGDKLKNSDVKFSVIKGARWKEIKNTVELVNIKFSDGYTLDEWKLGNAGGTVISDETEFSIDTTIYAVSSKKVTIRIDGDKLSKIGISLTVKSGTLWSEIKNNSKIANVEFTGSYTLDEWKLGGVNGSVITDDTVFMNETTVVYAAASEKVKVTVGGEHLKNGETSFVVKKGVEWSEVKNKAEIVNVEFEAGYILDEWRIKNTLGNIITDRYVFDDNITIYAVNSKKVIITIGGNNLEKNGVSLVVKSGSLWSEVKNRAEVANVEFEVGYTLDEWSLNSTGGTAIDANHKFKDNTTIYAIASEKVTITIDGNHLKKSGVSFIVKKGVKWSEVKNRAEIVNAEFESGYTLDEWSLESTSGTGIAENYKFDESTKIYAHASKKVTIRIDGGHVNNKGVSLTVKSGTPWSEVKKNPEIANVKGESGYVLDKWKLNDADGSTIAEDYKFENNVTIYAVALKELTITIDGKHLQNIGVRFTVKSGTKWSEVKNKAEIVNVEFESGYILDEWKLNDETGPAIAESYTFTDNKTIYAVASEKVTITIDGNHLKKSGVSFIVKKGVKWSEVKNKVEIVNAELESGYTLDEWKLEAGSGSAIDENYRFESDASIYAVSSEKVTITISGDKLKNSDVKFSVIKGARWKEIKNTVELVNIKFSDGYTLDEWKLGNAGGTVISDETEFSIDTTIYAVSSKKVTVRIDGDKLSKIGISLTVKSGTLWSEIKNNSKIANVEFTGSYTLDEWKLGGKNGVAITDETKFTDDMTVIYAVAKLP